MFIATLISSPGILEPLLVKNLHEAWRGRGDIAWLAPGEAAEFPLASLPQNQKEVWQDLQKLQIDLVVQPATHRRRKLLLADTDSTMIQQESIDELADEEVLPLELHVDVLRHILHHQLKHELYCECSVLNHQEDPHFL